MALKGTQLACERGGRRLFAGIDVEVGAGEALWVQGDNGSGKTSLLRLLCGLLAPTLGTVQWCGQDLRRLREDFHRELLYIGHAPGLKDELSAAENLQFGARLRGADGDVRDAEAALERVGLGRQAHLPAGRLSQGQRRRVALARLHLPRRPRLLVLDEPFAALDAAASERLEAALAHHLSEGGTVVYTTHQAQALRGGRLRTLALPC
jgi:heme exporter protein A